ncbi:MAG TPA: type II secretion system protein [Acidobacteriota bacterium]|nr:type II secretion system protein [Acidobacteriota bacterium]
MRAERRKRGRGFTLVELMIVVALIGLLVGIALPTYKHAQQKAKEAVLRENLFILRQTIDQYFADKGYYPASLQALVDEKYIRKLPVDPITRQADWEEVPADQGTNVDPNQPAGVWDVKSRAQGQTEDGVGYGEL